MPYPIHGNFRVKISSSLKHKVALKWMVLTHFFKTNHIQHFRPGGLDIVLSDVVEHVLLFFLECSNKNVF